MASLFIEKGQGLMAEFDNITQIISTEEFQRSSTLAMVVANAYLLNSTKYEDKQEAASLYMYLEKETSSEYGRLVDVINRYLKSVLGSDEFFSCHHDLYGNIPKFIDEFNSMKMLSDSLSSCVVGSFNMSLSDLLNFVTADSDNIKIESSAEPIRNFYDDGKSLEGRTYISGVLNPEISDYSNDSFKTCCIKAYAKLNRYNNEPNKDSFFESVLDISEYLVGSSKYTLTKDQADTFKEMLKEIKSCRKEIKDTELLIKSNYLYSQSSEYKDDYEPDKGEYDVKFINYVLDLFFYLYDKMQAASKPYSALVYASYSSNNQKNKQLRQ